MVLLPEPRHDLSAGELEDIERRLYGYNSEATGRDDGRGIGFVIRDGAGRIVGLAEGYSWAGIAEIRQMWVDADHRGQGHGRRLLDAFVAEARGRGVRRIWVSSLDFQAPGFYEKAGFRRVATLEGFPEGHANIVLCRELGGG